jgi:hypothetical protein
MAQVLYNLYRIQEKYPGFRHHDLHGGNVLVRPVPKKDIQIKLKDKKYTISNGGVEAVIIDFGFSVFPRIKNPLINTNNYKNIGISRKSDKFYDLHFFLNTMYGLTIQPHNMTERRVKSLVQSLLSPEYLDRMSEKVKMYRLRGNKSHTIPSFETVLSKPFFTGETALQMVIPVKKSQPRVIIQAPKPITPVNQKAAMARAIAAMKAKPKLVIRRK